MFCFNMAVIRQKEKSTEDIILTTLSILSPMWFFQHHNNMYRYSFNERENEASNTDKTAVFDAAIPCASNTAAMSKLGLKCTCCHIL